MKSVNLKRCGVAAIAMLFCAPPFAHAVMYKWTDETGAVTYSNTPPPDPSKVTNFLLIEDSSVPANKRPPDTAAPAVSAPKTDPVRADQATLRTDPGLKSDPAEKPESARSEPPRAATRSFRPEAVQDPCLRSADPLCHQRHKDKYHPYLGYAPSVTAASPVGASSSAAGSGSVGGQIRITPTPVAATPVKAK